MYFMHFGHANEGTYACEAFPVWERRNMILLTKMQKVPVICAGWKVREKY
jgi:hypothetical protein